MNNPLTKSLGFLALGVASLGAAAASPSLLRKVDDYGQASQAAKTLMERMTPEERFDFVRGTGFGIRAVPRLEIPALRFADASAGIRLMKDKTRLQRSTAFPCTELLAATWSPELAGAYAKAVAEEFRADGVHFILGPGMNIARSSTNGRNFEYLGEEPALSSPLVAAYVRGAQSVGVATTLKHFICNETEVCRRSTNVLIDARTLHELYLPPFVAGVEAGAWAVMTSYNAVNGEWMAQNREIVTGVLRKELGFKNLVMTDWSSTWDGRKLADSGVDLEMPSGHALKYDRQRVLGDRRIDEMVTNILATGIRSGLYEEESKGNYRRDLTEAHWLEHKEVARRVNREGIVLLQNDGILPLAPSQTGRILLTGNNLTRKELAGGGSGHVVGYDSKTYEEALREALPKASFVATPSPTDEQISQADAVILFAGWLEKGKPVDSEGTNHPFTLPDDALIARCASLNKKTIVVLVSGTPVAMDWQTKAAALVFAFYGGQTGAETLGELLTGKANFSGRLPFTVERNENDAPFIAEDGKTEAGRTLIDPLELAARTSEKAREFVQKPGDKGLYTRDLSYGEGTLVGYRYFLAHKIAPRFPFGFGLSYTSFSYSASRVATDANGAPASVSVTLRNEGKRAGIETVQLYARSLAKTGDSSETRKLCGFARKSLAAGETAEVVVPLQSRSFSLWSEKEGAWKAVPGAYALEIGRNAEEIVATLEVSVK